jgi:O-antigen ligase
MLIIIFIFSLLDIIKKLFNGPFFFKQSKIFYFVTLMFLSPILAILISQTLRNEFYLPNYDAPLRIAMCSIIFMAFSSGWKYNPSKYPISLFWIKYSFPSILLFTLINTSSWTNNWGDRLTTYFIDPLTFGSYCSLFTLITFISLTVFWKKLEIYKKIYLTICLLSGFYLIIKCGSRTGILSFPILIFLWHYFYAIRNYGLFKSNIIIIFIAATLFALLLLNNNFLHKILLIKDEIMNYKWDEVNLDHSVTMRINFIRMALYYFSLQPFHGWGDVGWMVLINNNEISKFSSEFGQTFAKNGFHNEILSNSVKSGIWGTISTSLVLFLPLYISIKNLYFLSSSKKINYISFSLLCISLHFILTSLSTEITNLVFTSSFIGLILAIFVGEIVYLNNRKDKIKDFIYF